MHPNVRRLRAAAAGLVLTMAAAGCGSSMGEHDMESMSTPAASASQPGASSTSTTPATGPHNDADVMFAAMMVPHHAQAIEMSDLILAKSGVDPQVADLATRIKGAQGPEIAQMNGWLAGWGASMGGMDHGGHDDGMMSEAEMGALQQSTDGAQAGNLFLTGMIKHHEGAVRMAQTELADGENPDAKQLAEAIITAQQAEITKMQELLAQ